MHAFTQENTKRTNPFNEKTIEVKEPFVNDKGERPDATISGTVDEILEKETLNK
jgi:hypothetical protein